MDCKTHPGKSKGTFDSSMRFISNVPRDSHKALHIALDLLTTRGVEGTVSMTSKFAELQLHSRALRQTAMCANGDLHGTLVQRSREFLLQLDQRMTLECSGENPSHLGWICHLKDLKL